ncbi:MAG: arylesterase [Rugosibacter sp.]|nr:arylesterase [Rugosibacter sp.]
MKSFLFIFLLIVSIGTHATQLATSTAPISTPNNVLVFGDSLSAGYGIAMADSWPALLNERLKSKRLPYQVINMSISGETTAGGRARLATALEQTHPAVVILALGANDGLRGLPIQAMEDNLTAMILTAKKQKARVLLVGIRLPPNYGGNYTQTFEAVYRNLAKHQKISLLPFLLEPIAQDAQSFQADGLHPTAEAQPRILNHVWPSLAPLLKSSRH